MTYYLITQEPGDNPNVHFIEAENYNEAGEEASDIMERFENENTLSILLDDKQLEHLFNQITEEI